MKVVMSALQARPLAMSNGNIHYAHLQNAAEDTLQRFYKKHCMLCIYSMLHNLIIRIIYV